MSTANDAVPTHQTGLSANTAPDVVHELVDRFERNRSHYRTGSYNETQVRREFIDPFFEALGWDVNNRQGYAEAYKDVVHEDALRIAGKHKAPDYSFRIGGTRKFFVEAKKPAVDLARDPLPALQVRRYAWSAKLPLSILTDFEELAVYDCRVQPEATDRPTTARTMLVPYTEYPTRWGEIYGRFSREAVLKGSFDQYSTSAASKRGTAEVDAVFLRDLQTWRELLARNIALRNAGISARELNFAVQQILDRLVFLRICEDRQIEDYGRLKQAVASKSAYSELVRLFRLAEDRYNSGLFHFKQEKGRTSQVDAVTPSLAIDDKVLKEIVKHLYYPDSPYEFSVVSSDILGQVYEQFLGQVIRLTPAGRAEVEDKPAVRKAGGVFYTPTFIVDYIVRRTIGRLLEGKTPKEVSLLRFLDPACGSGSFLIAVFQFLLDWHLAYYMADGPEKHSRSRPPRVYQSSGGVWRLTSDEKKRILLNNIYGVDIDSQAVEVTKLSLVLKVLEGETEESLGSQLELFQERVLPDLGSNIKCGNSLISPQDFYVGHQPRLLEEEEVYRVNPFDWKAEFPQVFAGPDPGFDVVLGNPPYIRIQTMTEWAPLEVEFFKRRYVTASKGNYDIYVVFVERGLELLNSKGLLGYILPHKFFKAQYGQALRDLISAGRHLSEVVNFGSEQVFAQATTYTALLFLDKAGTENFSYSEVTQLAEWRSTSDTPGTSIPTSRATAREWTFAIGRGADLFDRLAGFNVTLRDVADRVFQGLITGADAVFLMKRTAIGTYRSAATDREYVIEDDLMHPLCKGSLNIRRYRIADVTQGILFPYHVRDGQADLISAKDFEERYPHGWSYLCECRTILEARERGKWRHDRWYALGRSQNLTQMSQVKLLTPSIASAASFTLDREDHFFVGSGGGGGGGYGITIDKRASIEYPYLLGLLNSRLLDWYLRRISSVFSGGYYAYNRQYIEQLPIVPVDRNNADSVAQGHQVSTLVEQILALHARLQTSRSAHDRDVTLRQITGMERQIDNLVYGIYGLSSDDVREIESGIVAVDSSAQMRGDET